MSRKLEPGEYVLSGRHGVQVRAVVEGNSITIKRGSHISAATPSAFIGRHPNLKQERDRLLGIKVLEPRNEDGQPVDDPAHAANFEVMQDIAVIESDDCKPLTPHTAASLALAGDISAKRWEAAGSETSLTPRAETSDFRDMALANSAVKESQTVENVTNSNMIKPNAGEKRSVRKPASNALSKEPLGTTQLEESASEQSNSAYRSAEMKNSRQLDQPDKELEERIEDLQTALAYGLENYVNASRTVTEDIINYIDSKHPRPAFSITSRIKSTDSLRNKVLRKHPQRKYRNLNDFSDIAGVRLILYSTDFQGTIEDLNGRWSAGSSTGSGLVEFANTSNSYDLKGRESFDPNDAEDSWYFAYHFDLKVTTEKRGKKVEIPCEVQVTNIMRHAINEIGHDLVYKPSHPDEHVKQAWKTDQGLKDIFWALQLTLHAASTAVSKIQSKAYAIERSTTRIPTSATAEEAPANWKAPFIGSQRATLDATETLVRRLGLEWKQADKEADADISDRVPTVLQYAVNKGNSTIRKIVEDLDSPQGLVSSLEKLNMGDSLVLWSLENLLNPYNAKARVEHEARANGSNRAWLTSERSSDIVLLLLLELLAIKDPKGASAFYTGGATGDPRRKQGAPRILDRIVKTFMDGRSDHR